MSQTTAAVAADAILLLHAAFVGFVIGGLLATWLGAWRGWGWVRGWRFRGVHLFAMGVVLAQALGGRICPLTTLEDRLRLRAGQGTTYSGSFIQHWVGRLLFFDASPAVFVVLYAFFFALILATFWWVRPRSRRRPVDSPPVS